MFKDVTDTLDNEWIFKNILHYYTLELKPDKHEGIKENIFKNLISRNPDFPWKEQFPESFEAAVDTYLQQPITDEERRKFMLHFGVPFMSTGKSVEALYKLNPEGMTPTLDELIKSKRIQSLIYEDQGNILVNILREMDPNHMGFYKVWTTPETREIYKQRLKTKIAELRAMYKSQEETIAVTWVAALEAHQEFSAKENLHALTAQKIHERDIRSPNVPPEALAFYLQQTREKEAAEKEAAEKAAGGANTGGGRRRRRRGHTKRRKSKRKQTRRK